MPIALRLNFVDVVCDNSLKHLCINGKRIGAQFDVRLSYYRGQFLSVIDKLEVSIDGKRIPEQNVFFCLKEQEYGIAQLHDLVSVFWPVREPATIRVLKKGGFSSGEHEIDFTLIFRSPSMAISAAEYMPVNGSGHKKLLLKD